MSYSDIESNIAQIDERSPTSDQDDIHVMNDGNYSSMIIISLYFLLINKCCYFTLIEIDSSSADQFSYNIHFIYINSNMNDLKIT